MTESTTKPEPTLHELKTKLQETKHLVEYYKGFSEHLEKEIAKREPKPVYVDCLLADASALLEAIKKAGPGLRIRHSSRMAC